MTRRRHQAVTTVLTFAGVAGAAWLAFALFFSPRVITTCSGGSPVAFVPAGGLPEWLVIAVAAAAVIALLIAVFLPEPAPQAEEDGTS